VDITYIHLLYKGIFAWPIWRKYTVHMFTPRENNRLLDYYKIISISRPILAQANMGLAFVSGQNGCLFSRCRKYVIIRDYYMTFSISALVLTRDSHIKPDSEAGGLIWVEGWYQGPYGKFHVIIFLSHIWHWPFPSIDFYIAKRSMNRQIAKINP
jgi:hypothetical protein